MTAQMTRAEYGPPLPARMFVYTASLLVSVARNEVLEARSWIDSGELVVSAAERKFLEDAESILRKLAEEGSRVFHTEPEEVPA